jgi:hypothetical protein
VIRTALAVAAFGAAAAASTPVPLFEEQGINQQVAQIDLAGVHFGDTVEQVRETMRKDGWTVEIEQTFGGMSFRDKLSYAISLRHGTRFTRKDRNVPAVTEYRKGPQTLEVTYCAHSRGHLVCKISYSHANATSGALARDFENKVAEKFSRTPLIQLSRTRYCLSQDSRCFRARERGEIESDYPSVWSSPGTGTVNLERGELGRKLFDEDLRNAIERATGGLKDVSL